MISFRDLSLFFVRFKKSSPPFAIHYRPYVSQSSAELSPVCWYASCPEELKIRSIISDVASYVGDIVRDNRPQQITASRYSFFISNSTRETIIPDK